MDREGQLTLEILRVIAEGKPLTQRTLARGLGIALGLTNLYLKRLARKGYIKIRAVRPQRLRYYLTPTGLAEKARLTCAYMEYSLRLYRQTRQALREALLPRLRQEECRVVLYGSGEAAELTYLTLRELGLEAIDIVDGDGQGRTFLGSPVRSLAELAPDEVDLVVLATFAPSQALVDSLAGQGIPREKIVLLAGASAPR